ncbi:MAG: hypothetical protein DMF92_01645 [Acidobacteria bacterium]|nr:MAG: hypothetical protein DMF92_01645 [Acidobacteriota bacterium]
MPVPWLRILRAVIGVSDFALSPARGPAGGEEDERLVPGTRALGQLETRLAGVVVAALQEAFDRDSRRLELEREQLEAERRRAERLLQLELLRQAGDREVGRLRLLAGVAAGNWLGTLFFSARLAGGSLQARIALGVGWALLLTALALSFVAQSHVADALSRMDEPAGPSAALSSNLAGKLSPWLIVIGLALIGVAMLVG